MNHGHLQSIHHYWLPLAIVGGLVLLTTWLGQISRGLPVPSAAGKPGHVPDYFVDDLKAVGYDVAGVPRYHMTAKKMVHFLDDDTTQLESPAFLRDGPGVPKVDARSKRGQVSPKGEIVYLIDDVNVTQTGMDNPLPIEMQTQYLKIWPNEDRIASDRPVVVRQGASVIHGNAMQADGKARTFDMESGVKGLYEQHH